MSKYIGSSAVNLSTTSADVTGNADIDGNLTVGGNLTVSGTTITVDHATAQTVDLGDGDKIRLGADYELQLWSDGTTGQISGDINHTGSITTDGLTVNGGYLTVDNGYGITTVGGLKYIADSDNNAPSTGLIHQFFTDNGTSKAATISKSGDISFYDTSGNAKFFWDASAESLGIGTSPSAKLDVNGEVFVSPNTAGKNTFQLTTNASNDARFKMLSDTTEKVDIQANGDSYFNGGNVAIGTSLPSQKITVGFADNSTDGISFRSSSYANLAKILAENESSSQNGNLQFYTRSGGNVNEAMRIESGGDVKVEKNLTVKNQKALYFNNTGGYSPRLSNASDQSALSSFINNSESLRLNSSCLSIFSSGQFANTYGNSTRTNLQIDGSGEAILTMSIGGTMAGYVNAGTTDMVVAAKTGSKIRLIPNGTTANEVIISTGGNIVMKNGAGIDFSATSNGSGTTSSELLDDYEEGTWTPTVSNGTISFQHNRYTKIGRQVTVSAFIYNFSDRTTAAALAINGLPFTTSASSRTVGSVMLRYSNNTSITASYATANTTAVEFYGVTSASWDVLQYNDLNSASAEIYFTISYTV